MSEGESNTSFLSLLLQKKKSKLQPTETKVTKSDGTVTIFKHQGLENISTEVGSYGFVVDTKPDLTVGVVQPWLLISSQDVPNDLSLIQQFGITHILSLLPGFELNPLVVPLIRQHLTLDLYDEECFSLDSEVVDKAMEFIKKVEGIKEAKVLIHCNAGISRAPSVALMYLIKCQHLSFDDAWTLVKKSRPSIKPNDGFLRQLQAIKPQNIE